MAFGLGAVELWASHSLDGAQFVVGPIMGAVLGISMGLFPVALKGASTDWARAVIAGLSSVVELLFCVVVLGSLQAVVVLLLPVPISARLFDSEWATDFVILSMFALGLVVASRGWLKYSRQSRRAAAAMLDVERARAQIAERDQELVRSELTVLRAQIEPHFLWNTLAHVKHLSVKSPKDAEAMLGHLIQFLRATVPQTRETETTLGAEMASVEAYLALMKIRMGARLCVQVKFDPLLANHPYPPFLIQTLVENAVKHGIEPKVGTACIEVRAGLRSTDPDQLDQARSIVVEVEDDGIGLMAAPPTSGTGMGLRNVRSRLRLLYGERASLRIDGARGGGVMARVEIPASPMAGHLGQREI